MCLLCGVAEDVQVGDHEPCHDNTHHNHEELQHHGSDHKITGTHNKILQGDKCLLCVLCAKKTNEWVLNKAGVKEGTVRHCQSKETSILWSDHEETRELSGERDNARNNARWMQARKTTHGLDGQHQDVDRTPRGRVNQNDRGQR